MSEELREPLERAQRGGEWLADQRRRLDEVSCEI